MLASVVSTVSRMYYCHHQHNQCDGYDQAAASPFSAAESGESGTPINSSAMSSPHFVETGGGEGGQQQITRKRNNRQQPQSSTNMKRSRKKEELPKQLVDRDVEAFLSVPRLLLLSFVESRCVKCCCVVAVLVDSAKWSFSCIYLFLYTLQFTLSFAQTRIQFASRSAAQAKFRRFHIRRRRNRVLSDVCDILPHCWSRCQLLTSTYATSAS